MATDPSGIIANLLAGTGYGRTVGDYQQQNIQNQLGQQQLATGALQAQAIQQKQAQEARWQAWSADYAKDPSPQKLAQGVVMFPDQADALQKSYQIMDEPARISRVTQLSQIYNAAKAGRADLASQQIDGIINAEKQQGIDTSEAEGIKASLASGDKSALTQLQAFAQAHLAAASPEFAKAIGVTGNEDKGDEYGNTPQGDIYSHRTGEITHAGQGRGEWVNVTNDDGSVSRVWHTVGGGDPSSGTAAAPGGSGAPLSVRLNNPGAIRANPANKWQGQIGSQNGFVQFDTPENGARAHRILISHQVRDGYNTPATWAAHYAPASDGNNPDAYAATIAKGLGIGVNDKIPLSAVPKMAAISAQVESGGSPAPASSNAGPAPLRVKPPKSTAAGLDADTVQTIAQQYLAGDKMVMSGLARTPGAVAQVRQEIAKQAKAQGWTGKDIAAQMADFTATTSAARAVGTRIANVDLAATETEKLIPLALAASDALPRAGFTTIARIQQAYRSGTNDPRLRQFVAANNSLVNAYSRAISPSGVPTVDGQNHAREMLNTSFDNGSYRATVNQMWKEVQAARAAPAQVRQDIRNGVTGASSGTPTRTATNPATGQKLGLIGGKWVPLK